MKQSDIRLDEYVEKLWEQRNKERVNESSENLVRLKNGEGLSSPGSDLPAEELKLVQQHIHRSNLFQLSKALPNKKKELILRKFFKHKRNQQVEVFIHSDPNNPIHIVGKVNTIGRDFVTLTTLKDRIWLPYSNIESANVPYGLPEVSSTHQHFAYDEELRNKLITRFSETVISKDVLLQQFFEETLETNLQTWKGTNVKVITQDTTYSGKIVQSKDGIVELKRRGQIPLSEIKVLKTIRLSTMLMGFFRSKSHIRKEDNNG
ncbi:hypothetical protein [Alkalihalobacterium bogoriense]|uniref:hypothetical protein n=1 Tax=Alkalihalobacterium bogoriense TaxID=246272 RepID=UPI00054EBA0F|nr:hypothetical protein [Alkalihalobacterium bogoriense]